MALFNLARMTVSSSGTGTITLNSAVSGFLTFDLSGCSTASAGQAVTYAINDTTQSEIGSGTYTSSALSLTRGSSTTGLKSTNGNSPINMSNAAQVFITPQAVGIIGRVVVQAFSASTTYFPTTGLISCVLECVGGGGGGGGCQGLVGSGFAGAGGGGGGYSRLVALASAIGTSQTVTVGAGGAAGGANTSGGGGGDTSVGTLCIAKGGTGGSHTDSATAPTPGTGQAGGVGDIVGFGAAGGAGLYEFGATGVSPTSGGGGNSIWGAGGPPQFSNGSGTNGANGNGYGAGGSGGSVHNTGLSATGGAGTTGFVVVTEYCNL